ncbi:MAG: hypothetical protein ACRD3Q_19625, partial [Terriglobales bacterium]
MRLLATCLIFLVSVATLWSETTEHQLRFPVEGAIISGTLYSPDAAGPHPALVVVPGAGNFDRKTLAKINSIIREPLLSRGYSVLF